MPALKITRHAHDSAALWTHVGPLLCTRDLHRSLGGPVVADETTTWWVATEGKRCVGFACVRLDADVWHIEASYVVPGDRSAGTHTALCQARDAHLADAPDRTVSVSCKLERWHHYEAQGYVRTRQRGQWVWGRKPGATPAKEAE